MPHDPDAYAAAAQLRRKTKWDSPSFFRHKVTGQVYRLADIALNESTLELVAVYVAWPSVSAPTWTRPWVEFCERFVAVAGEADE